MPSSDSPLLPPLQARRKRIQVSRACESCRVHRLKCDDHSPCRNCTKRGAPCSKDGASRLSTLPQAHREIEALRQKVAALELELQNARSMAHGDNVHQINTPTSEPPSRRSPPPPMWGGLNSDSDNLRFDTVLDPLPRRVSKSWSGIHIRTARSQQTTWFGPSSLFCFIGRISAFLSKSMQSAHPATHMLPDSASKRLYGPASPSEGDSRFAPNSTAKYLSSVQEEYFLDLFWQSYHVVYPLFNEADFKEHYQSLWAAGTSERRPSALVEIVLALSLQYGMALSPARSTKAQADGEDATIAGRWYYQRCQALLASELETPTLATLQCHILCSIYLCCGSFINMADGACALAVRTAYMIGLHVDPPESMTRAERELRRRLWWIMYVLESKMSMKLGRPFSMHMSSSTCVLPEHHPEVAALLGSSFARLGEGATWLTFTRHNIELLLVARAVHTALYAYEDESINHETSQAGGDAWQDPTLLESHAKASSSRMHRLSDWAEAVPSALRTPRRNGGTSLSTDLTPLAIEQFAPLWLQRQRLLLELMYHNLSANLCRPFIHFSPKSTTSVKTDRLAAKCAAHAAALTHMMDQILSETSILDGWHEAFQWQWNSAVTLVGFVLSQPSVGYEEAVRNARNGIDLAVATLERFGVSFAVAASAAGIIKSLSGVLQPVPPERHEMLSDRPVGGLLRAGNALGGDATEAFHGQDVQRVGEDNLGDTSGQLWPQDETLGNAPLWNFDDMISAPMLEELGQSVTSMFGVEACNFFDSNIDMDAFPNDWLFEQL